MKNHSPLSTQNPNAKKNRPLILIFFTVLWFVLTMLLFNGQHQGTSWGRSFLSQVATSMSPNNAVTTAALPAAGSQAANNPNPGNAMNQAMPGPMPSPTLYVPDAPKATGDYLPVSFSNISGFFFWNPIDYSDGDVSPAKEKEDKARSKVPASVMAYNGKKVAITGFMIPLDENDKMVVTTFVLAKSQMTCCYGATPMPNDWLYASVAPNASKVMDQMDVPLTVYGTLSIDPKLKDPGMPTLYKMVVDKVQGPKKSWF